MSPRTTMPERDAYIVKLWAANVNSRQIAERLGITRNTVIGAIDRARKRGELPLYRDDTYVPETRQLAHEAKVKAARDKEAQRLATQTREEKMQTERRRKVHETKAAANPFVAPPEPVSEPPPARSETGPSGIVINFFEPDPLDLGGVSLANAKVGQCRSILPDITHKGMAVFCGRPTKTLTSSWCAKHHALYYSRVPPKRDGFVILKRKDA